MVRRRESRPAESALRRAPRDAPGRRARPTPAGRARADAAVPRTRRSPDDGRALRSAAAAPRGCARAAAPRPGPRARASPAPGGPPPGRAAGYPPRHPTRRAAGTRRRAWSSKAGNRGRATPRRQPRRARRAATGDVSPAESLAWGFDFLQQALEDRVGVTALELELGRGPDAVAQRGQGHALHVVGGDVVAAFQEGGATRRT